MKIAITTPTGHVGSAVTNFLLDRGGDIRVKLLSRRPGNLGRLAQRGAEIAVGARTMRISLSTRPKTSTPCCG